MMENYDRTIELVNTAYDSAGKSSEQFAKYQDTVEYKLNQISNGWEQLRTNLFNSDAYKGALDILNNFINTINNMNIGQFIGIGLIGLTLGKMVITNFIKSLQSSSASLSKNMQTAIENGIKNLQTSGPAQLIQNKINQMTGGVRAKIALNVPLEALRQAGVATEHITNENAEQILKYTQEKEKLQEIKTQIEQLEQLDTLRTQEQDERLKKLKQELIEQQKLNNETRNKITGVSDTQLESISSSSNVQNVAARNARLQQAAAKITPVASDALSASLTTALTMAVSGSDFTTSLKTAGITALTSIIPAVISEVAPVIVGALLTIPGLVITAVAALTIGIAVHMYKVEKANEKAEKAELKRLRSVQKANEEAQKEIDNNIKSMQAEKSKNEKLNKDIERYNELKGKAFLNSSEQTEFESLAESINSTAPEIVESYDELTHELQINSDALKEMNDTVQNDILKQNLKNNAASVTQVNNALGTREATQQLLNNFQQTALETIATVQANNGEIIFTNSDGKIGVDNKYFKDLQSKGLGLSSDEKNIVFSLQELLSGISLENAKKAGITEDQYNTIINAQDSTDISTIFDNTDFDFNKFIGNVQEAAQIQTDVAKDYLKQANDNRIRTKILTDERLELEEGAIDILSNINQDGIDFRHIQANQAAYFKESTGKEFLASISQGSYENVATYGNISDMKEAIRLIGYGQEADEEKGIKALDTIAESEFDELHESLQTALAAAGIDKETWNTAYKDNLDAVGTLIQGIIGSQMFAIQHPDWITGTIDTSKLLENQDQINAVVQQLNDTGNLTLDEYRTKLDELIKAIPNEELQAAAQAELEKSDNMYGKFKSDQEQLKIRAGNNNATNKIIEQLSYGVTSQLLTQINDFNLDESQAQQITNALASVYDGLTTEQQNILLSVDLTSSYTDLIAKSSEYILALNKAGVDVEKAKEKYMQLINESTNTLKNGVLGKDAVNILNDSLNERLSKLKEENSLLLEAQKEFFEDNKLSSETYFKMIEAGFSDFVEVTSDGYKLLSDKASEFWTTQALAGKEGVKKQIDINNQLLSSLAVFESEEHFTFSLAEYKEGKTNSFSPEQLNILRQAVEQNITTMEEFKQKIAEANEELQKVYIDQWIGGLIQLQENYNNTKEEIDELKESLNDLNEELEENKKQIEEADKAYQEAVHGTDSYRSSLDGLINYERKLKSLNDELERTSKALNKSESVDQAKELLKQTTALTENKIAVLGAEKIALEGKKNNIEQMLLNQFGDYLKINEDGIIEVNFAFEQMDDSDIMKDLISDQLDEYYSTIDEYQDKDKEIIEEQEKNDEAFKASRDKRIEIEETVIDILKEKMQEEVDAVEEKYAAMEEADNDYVDALQDAIDRQRKLRDSESKYEDLATKQRKLALMQRDTSGANSKNVASLQKDIENDRQSLLDNEVDNIIDSMKELYDKQKEARELEIEAMKMTVEDMDAIKATAMEIIAGFTTLEDYQGWLLENDTTVKDMTVTQTEAYLDSAAETFAGYTEYIARTTQEIKIDAELMEQESERIFNTYSQNITDAGDYALRIAQEQKEEEIKNAKEAKDEAIKAMEETQEKINETRQKLLEAEDAAAAKHDAVMKAMVEASKSGVEEVAAFAMGFLIDSFGGDLSSKENVDKFAEMVGATRDGKYSQVLVDEMNERGYDTSYMQTYEPDKINNTQTYGSNQYTQLPTYSLQNNGRTVGNYASYEEALRAKENNYPNNDDWKIVTNKKYAKGGLVDYTGPAWVDGTKNKPEAFLSAADTERIGNAARLLSNLPLLDKTNFANGTVTSNIGDTSIEIHINVENLSSDYDVDQMIERVKKDIVDVSNPVGTPVIIRKR